MGPVKAVLVLVICCLFIAIPLSQGAPLTYTGVNEAGAEFGSGVGNYGSNYQYPTADSINHLRGLGMNVFRLPFLWERLQTTLGSTFDSAEQARLISTVQTITNGGSYVLLDPHNYARYPYNGAVIGNGGPTNAQFQSFWQQLAALFPPSSYPRVIFGVMNEPNGEATENWLATANAGIAGIRASGATQLITVPGNGYTGAHSWGDTWYGTSNANVMTGVVDSRNNFAFEIHQYFDGDYSGRSEVCVDASNCVPQFTFFTSWARSHGYRAFLGEFAGGNNQNCQTCIGNVLSYLEANSDVYIGWTWWAAGPLWGNYFFSLEPTSNGDKPQTAWLIPHLAGNSGSPLPPPSVPVTPSPASLSPSSSIAASRIQPSPGSAQYAIYTDSLQRNWALIYSFNLNYNIQYSGTYVYSGSNSISVNPANYGALYFTCDSSSSPSPCFDQSYTLSFFVSGGANGGGQVLRVQLRDAGLNQVGNQQTFTVPNNGWLAVNIPVSSFGVSGPFSGFTIQDNGGNSGNTVYFDEIYLYPASVAASASNSPAVVAASASSSSAPSASNSPAVVAASASRSSAASATSPASASSSAGASRSSAPSASSASQPSQTSLPSQTSQPVQNGQTSQPSQTRQPGTIPTTQVIYDDNLKSNWQITQQPQQWSQTQSAVTYGGSSSAISWTPQGRDFITFQCYNQQCMNTQDYYGLYLKVSGGSTSGQTYSIQLTQNNAKVGNAVTLTVASNGWNTVQLPLSGFGSPSGKLDGFIIQGGADSSQATIYFDNIYVIAYSGSMQVVFPSNKRSSRDVSEDAAAATGIPREQVTSPAANTVEFFGLSQSQINTVSSLNWLSKYNQVAGTNYTPSQVKATSITAAQPSTDTSTSTGSSASRLSSLFGLLF